MYGPPVAGLYDSTIHIIAMTSLHEPFIYLYTQLSLVHQSHISTAKRIGFMVKYINIDRRNQEIPFIC